MIFIWNRFSLLFALKNIIRLSTNSVYGETFIRETLNMNRPSREFIFRKILLRAECYGKYYILDVFRIYFFFFLYCAYSVKISHE